MLAILYHFTVHGYHRLDSIDTGDRIVCSILREAQDHTDLYSVICCSDKHKKEEHVGIHMALSSFIAHSSRCGQTVALDYNANSVRGYELCINNKSPLYHIRYAWWCPSERSENEIHNIQNISLCQAIDLVRQNRVCDICLNKEPPLRMKYHVNVPSRDLQYLHYLWIQSRSLFTTQ